MSTTVDTTMATATSARPSPTSCHNLYDTPARDAVCAMPYSEEHIGYLESCCKGAEIYSYHDDCGLYCAAEGQTVGDLTKCLFDEGAGWTDVFCRGQETASATGDGEPIASATASSVADSDDNDDDNNDENDDSNDSNNDNDDDNSDDSSNDDDDNAAGVLAPRGGVTVVGVVISAMLLSAGVFGI